MAQHDYVIANGTGAAVRSDLNNALAAIVSNNSGSTEPTTTYAYQWWADTTAGQLKLRNAANDNWIVIQELDGTMLMEDGSAASPGLAFASDLDTGFFRAGTNQLGIATNGTVRLTATTTAITSALPVDVLLGSASTPSYTFTGDLNTGIYSPGADKIAIATGGTGRLFVDASGNVGVGTASPGYALDVVQASDAQMRLRTSGTTSSDDTILRFFVNNTGGSNYIYFGDTANGAIGVIRYNHSTDALSFDVNASERARIDSSGRLLVGTTTTSADVRGIFQARSGDSSGHTSVLLASGSSSPADGAGLGFLTFSDSGHTTSAWIHAARDGGTWSGSSKPTRLVFSTTADGASSPTERLRIANDGSISSVIPGGSTLYPRFGCRAWVNFNGTGTVAIRGSGNVSSITDNGIGDYTVNFTTAMPDANYSLVVSSTYGSANGFAGTAPTTTAARVSAYTTTTGASLDSAYMCVSVFR